MLCHQVRLCDNLLSGVLLCTLHQIIFCMLLLVFYRCPRQSAEHLIANLSIEYLVQFDFTLHLSPVSLVRHLLVWLKFGRSTSRKRDEKSRPANGSTRGEPARVAARGTREPSITILNFERNHELDKLLDQEPSWAEEAAAPILKPDVTARSRAAAP